MPLDPTASLAPGTRLAAGVLLGVNLGFAGYAFRQQCGYAEVLLVYLAEIVAIGILSIPKLLIVALFARRIDTIDQLQSAGSRTLGVALLLLFSSAAFALVCVLLYVAIVAMPSTLAAVDRQAGFEVARHDQKSGVGVEWAIAALAVSHLFSFFVNFLWRGEFRGASLMRIGVQPLLRVLGVVGIIGLALAIAFAQPWMAKSTIFALVVIAAKIVVDYFAYFAERGRLKPAALVQPGATPV
jgi:hypothetical protein